MRIYDQCHDQSSANILIINIFHLFRTNQGHLLPVGSVGNHPGIQPYTRVVSCNQPLPLYEKEGSSGLLSYVSFKVILYNQSEISGCYKRAEFQDVGLLSYVLFKVILYNQSEISGCYTRAEFQDVGLLSYVLFKVIPYNQSEISGCYTRAEFQDVGLLSYVLFKVIPYNQSEISGCYTRAEFQDVG